MFHPTEMFRTAAAGALNADAPALPANPGLDMGGPDLVPMTIQVHVPALAAPGDTLDITISESDDGATWRSYLTFAQITAVGEYFITGKSDARYRQANFNISAGADFGLVECGYVTGGRYTRF